MQIDAVPGAAYLTFSGDCSACMIVVINQSHGIVLEIVLLLCHLFVLLALEHFGSDGFIQTSSKRLATGKN